MVNIGGEMKSTRILIILIISIFAVSLTADNHDNSNFGIKVMAGGRYDDMRMCVGSDAGVKGGPIADVMLLYKKQSNQMLI